MLLDLRMPGMDGSEVRRHFAADPVLASIPIVVMSADHDIRTRASGMDVQGFVAKPFDLDEVERVVQGILS
jgi:CheY-like chemotaxis protein